MAVAEKSCLAVQRNNRRRSSIMLGHVDVPVAIALVIAQESNTLSGP